MDRFTVNFRPLNEQRDWQAKIISGQAILGSMSKTTFGYQIDVHTFNRDDLSIRFISKTRSHSFDYNLAKSEGDVYLYEISPKIFSKPPPVLPEGQELVLYFADDSDADGDWGLHIWDERGVDWTKWDQPLPFQRVSDLEPFRYVAKLPLPSSDRYSASPPNYRDFPSKLGFIVHRGQEKSVAHAQYMSPDELGRLYFVQRGRSEVYCSPDLAPCPSLGLVAGASAHWIAKDQLVWDTPLHSQYDYQLLYSPDAENMLDGKINPSPRTKSLPLIPSQSSYQAERFPHLQQMPLFHLNISEEELDQAIRSQLYALAINKNNGEISHVTRVQIAGVLDENYRYEEELGLVLAEDKTELRVWAPTAKSLMLQLYGHDHLLKATLPMNRNQQGVWSLLLPRQWVQDRLYYRFQLEVYHYQTDRIEKYEVTDPYSISLAANSVFSQLVDLSDPDLKPENWDSMEQLPAVHPSDISILELHIRDFSSYDHSVAEHIRGGYLAFAASPQNSEMELTHGQKYLKTMQEAGLTHVQLLPANDFATVRERREERIELSDPFHDLCRRGFAPQALCEEYGDEIIESVLQRLPKDTGAVQEIERYLRPFDGFNWGYDPLHFGVPEGSYASDPEGPGRIKEFRQMVQALTKLGLRVAMDVVYNHSFASGVSKDAVLDRIVPGYYHRRDPDSGRVETSSCCANTASEHFMMEKLIVDTLLRWQKHYRIDAFRFDLMGHHMKRNMLKIKQALGPNTYLYGEGWDFGEVANGQRGENATQANLSGTGIGTFNDRLRDAIRGGSVFDCASNLARQGYGNGMFVEPNTKQHHTHTSPAQAACSASDQRSNEEAQAYREVLERVKVGLVGSLKKYPLLSSDGTIKTADQIRYGDGKLGYTSFPFETINYISKHDNQTLWDINQLKLPAYLTLDERRQAQEFAISINLLAQGIPFFQLGTDLLRSKSLNRDSYNSGDWFNRVDYTGHLHNWNIGLPREDKDGVNWPFFKEILRILPERPSREQILLMRDRFRMWLRIRYSTPLFRLRDADEVIKRVRFIELAPQLNEPNGIIAMKIGDERCRHNTILDQRWNDVVVIFNPYPTALLVEAPGYQVHDELVSLIAKDGETFWLGARSSGVWLRPKGSQCQTDQPIRAYLGGKG